MSNMADPRLLHKEIIGGRGTYSEANYNPKAFNYFAPLNALAFPIDLYAGDTTGGEYGVHDFTGLYVYRVTVEQGFEFLGRISSAPGVTDDGCFVGYYDYTRGVFIDDNVYSVTQIGVKSASIDDVGTIESEAPFANAPTPVEECYWYGPDFFLPDGEGVR